MIQFRAQHVSTALVVVVGIVVAPAGAQAAGELFTVAGTGHVGPLGDGGFATAAAVGGQASLAALPGGGFVIGERGRVRFVDAAGRIHTLAGTGRPGRAGDGGPALSATVDPGAIAVAADGSVLIAQCDTPRRGDFFSTVGRVRRIAPGGTITTVAGGSSPPTGDDVGDGGPAAATGLGCLASVAALPDGGFVIAEANRVRRVDASGTIDTIAGTGEEPDAPLSGSRPATEVAISPADVAVTVDGRILIADHSMSTVLEVRQDGLASIVAGSGEEGPGHDDGRPAVQARVSPLALAALPDGGFVVADESLNEAGTETRIRRVTPDGRITTVAGTGRFVNPAPTGLEDRGDGGSALRADLFFIDDIALAADGGLLIAEGIDEFETPALVGLIRYLAPPVPGLLATALARDHDRFFRPGQPAAVTVISTAAATARVHVRVHGRTIATLDVAVPAGRSRVALPSFTQRARHRVTLAVADAAGRVSLDRVDLFPRGWLTEEAARYAARGAIFSVADWPQAFVVGCRRFSTARVDCGLTDVDGRRCKIALTFRLGADRRLRWGSYRCPYRSHPKLRRRMRLIAAKDTRCESSDVSCDRLTGRLRENHLLPWG